MTVLKIYSVKQWMGIKLKIEVKLFQMEKNNDHEI